MSITLNQIAKTLGLPAPARGDRVVAGVSTLVDAGPDELSMVGSDAYVKLFAKTKAMAVLAGPKVKLPAALGVTVFRVDDVEAATSLVLGLFASIIQKPAAGRHPSAVVAATAKMGQDCAIGPNVVIGERCSIGAGVALHANVIVGDDCVIGDRCDVYPNVVLRERVTLGSRVVIHAGSVIGSDGFGYQWNGKQHAKVPQIGTVVIEDDVELGSCVCVDRAKFGATRIGRGTKIDNLVQIAHNVQIGPHCIIVAQTGIAGSAKLGTGVVLGGQTAVRDHISLGDASVAAARSAIANNVPARTTVSGMPALPHRQNLREQAALRRLPELLVQVRHLQEEVKRLAGK